MKIRSCSGTNDRIDRSSCRPNRLKPGRRKKNARNISSLSEAEAEAEGEWPVSAETHSPSGQSTVHDDLTSILSRIGKPERSTRRAGSGSEFKEQPSKKVSFNDVVDSYSANKRSTFTVKARRNHSSPRSILKKTARTTSSNERTKKRNRKRMICETALEERELPTPKQLKAFAYLDTWKHSKINWKFEKVIQTWLLKNMFDSVILPDEKFSLLLEYVTEMRGAAVLFARRSSTEMIQHSELSENAEKDATREACCSRAKLVLHHLPE